MLQARLIQKMRFYVTQSSTVAMTVALVCAFAVSPAGRAENKLKIITATTDLASLAQEVGGDKVDVESIAKGYQDPHFVEAKPSFLLKLRK
ncbi:MAG: zinc/manganese transport system substrate-binding protein, partial [Acidobacteriaceae bacterium]|nr:zinc/manganese transport system substrate-binding protein [Acidobacteriaceae bacterium]